MKAIPQRSRRKTCRWCGKRLLSERHPHTETMCFVKNERSIRSKMRPKVKRISDVYEGGKLRSAFVGSNMEDILLKRQQQKGLDAVLGLGANGYKVPRNVSHMIAQGFVWTQVANQRPWAVYVFTPKGKRRKRFNNLYDAVEFHARITRLGLKGGIVSLPRSYELPPEWRLRKAKLPKRFKWCPNCADFRTFHRVDPAQRFEAPIKVWSEEKQRFEWRNRMIWLTECQVCGNTNRSPVFRRANQPYEVRKIKAGVRRVKPRKGAPTRKVRRKRL